MNITIRQLTENRFLKFLVIGGVNTVFGYLMFFLLTLTGLHYSLSALFATVAGVVFNFFTISRFVFRKRENRLLAKFCLVYGIVYVLDVFSIRVIKEFGLGVLVIQAILLFPTAIISYTLNRIIVFRSGTIERRSDVESRGE
jgi:putative flippase GtrA